MAHIYVADKRQERDSVEHATLKGTPEEKAGSIREKKDEQSWGQVLNPFYQIIKWICHSKVFRIFAHAPFWYLNAWGHVLGHFILGTSKSIRRKMKVSLQALYPNASDLRITQLVDASAKYLAMLFLDIIFRFPLSCEMDLGKFYVEDHFERLNAALAQGKGVIIPILHIGEYLHPPNYFGQFPDKYTIVIVASIRNVPLYEYSNSKKYRRFYIYASTKFKHIAPFLERHLRQNHLFMAYHDYSSPGQLRVPFIDGVLPYLIYTPQSYIALHRSTGAVILPCIGHPYRVFGRTRLEFLDNTSIMEISKRYRDASETEFHGRLSTEINRVIYPYVRQYAHMWEELMRLGERRLGDNVSFEKNLTMGSLISTVDQKLREILTNSFEPRRDDTRILNLLDETFPHISRSMMHPEVIFRDHRAKIDLSRLSGWQEFARILQITNQELNRKEESAASFLVNQLHHELIHIFYK